MIFYLSLLLPLFFCQLVFIRIVFFGQLSLQVFKFAVSMSHVQVVLMIPPDRRSFLGHEVVPRLGNRALEHPWVAMNLWGFMA